VRPGGVQRQGPGEVLSRLPQEGQVVLGQLPRAQEAHPQGWPSAGPYLLAGPAAQREPQEARGVPPGVAERQSPCPSRHATPSIGGQGGDGRVWGTNLNANVERGTGRTALHTGASQASSRNPGCASQPIATVGNAREGNMK